MARRSGRSLTFADAVRMLDDDSPFVQDLDELISHAFDAVPGGKLLALPYFVFRSKLVEYGNKLVRGLRDRVEGVGRYDRTQRLHAAHAVIAMTAFAEALGELLDGVDLQIRRSVGASAVAEVHGRLVLCLNDDAMPDPASAHWANRLTDTMMSLYSELAMQASMLLSAWGLGDAKSGKVSAIEGLPELALRRYEQHYRRLVTEAPEFAAWAYLSEHEATRAELGARIDALTTGLEAIPKLLATMPGRAAANRVRADLARAYQAVLTRSVLGEAQAADGVVLPTMARGYVNPAVRVTSIHSGARPSEDLWWDDRQWHEDVQAPLIGALTAADAADGPLVVLGQPGAGKSLLTHMLAARLADHGFLPVRVELRNVPADADVQTQVEHAIRDTIGRSIEWPELADSARDDGLLPLVMFDGFDELLQATGVNRTDYLEQVGRFQRRELDLGRPMVAIVTSRTAVADRARFPASGMVIRLEPFDETRVARWLRVWNETNAAPLDAATVLRYGELAEQPLLLTLLALYDAGGGALVSAEAELNRAELYDRLLSEFARREVRKRDGGLDLEQEHRAVADELRPLEIAALAMFNRRAKAITGEQLDGDLAAFLPDGHSRDPDGIGLVKSLTAAQLTVGRFFFIHMSSAQRAGETEHAYEFLHETLGEFLAMRYIVETLRRLARDRAYFRDSGRLGPLDDGELWAALSFAALTGSAANLEFAEGLLNRLPDDERAAVRELTVELLKGAHYSNPRRSFTDYEPKREPIFARHTCYSANLVVLAVLSTSEPLDFHPIDIGVWREALRYEEFAGLRDAVRVLSIPGGDGYDLRIVREERKAVDSYESDLRLRLYGRDLNLSDRFFVDDGFGSVVSDDGILVPVARGLLELRLASFASHGAEHRCALYEWCFDHAGTGCERQWLDVVFRQLREDVRELDPSDVGSLLGYALNRNALDMASEGFLDVLHALRDVDEAQFRALVDTDDRIRQLVTDDPQKQQSEISSRRYPSASHLPRSP